MNRKSIFAIAAVAVGLAAIIYVAAIGFPPQSDDVVGTIGAANGDRVAGVEQAERYRAQQIDDADVTLDNPEIQELLQDDEVVRLIQDPAFQRAMGNEVLRNALFRTEVQSAIMQSEFATALSRVEARQVAATALSRQQREAAARELNLSTEMARVVAENAAFARVMIDHPQLARVVNANHALSRSIAQDQALQRLFSDVQVLNTMAALQRSANFSPVAFQKVATSNAAFSMLADAGQRNALYSRAATASAQF